MCASIGSDATACSERIRRSFDRMGGGASKSVRAQAEPGHEGIVPDDPDDLNPTEGQNSPSDRNA